MVFWRVVSIRLNESRFALSFLIIVLIAVVTGFSLLSQGIAQWAGIY
jgi:uncharacterized membrane protein YtjA (UPF0391 family)